MFKEIKVEMPDHDCDVCLSFPNGQKVYVQSRPSNADVDYEGSLDVILPYNMNVTNWIDDDMQAAPEDGAPHIRLAKQLVMEIPRDARE